MIAYKLNDDWQSRTLEYASQEKSPELKDEEKIINNYFDENSDILLALINLIAMTETSCIKLSTNDCHYIYSLIDNSDYSYRALLLVNKLSACECCPFIEEPFFLYDHLFQLLEKNQNNIIISTISNFITKSKPFAEHAIENEIISLVINKYSNEQQDMIPWIANCFLFHEEIHIIDKMYPFIDHIMENIGLISFNSKTELETVKNFIQIGFQVLTNFMIKTKNYSYFIYHHCFPRNITLYIDNKECQCEQSNFVYSLTKSLQSIPINFPYFDFFNLAKSYLSNSNEKNESIILKCIYYIILKSDSMEDLIQIGFVDILQEMLQTRSFKVKNYIVLILIEFLANNSLTLKMLDLLSIDFFDSIQDFVYAFDEDTSLKVFNSFSKIVDNISNEEQLAKSKQFLESLTENQNNRFGHIEKILLPNGQQV